MISGLTTSALAQRTTAPAELTTTQLILGFVTAVGIGSIAAAVITSVTTSRRERGAWLRELQIVANREFHAAVQALVTFVEVGPPKIALETPDHAMLAHMATDIDNLMLAISDKLQQLIHVGPNRTADVAYVVFRHINTYARLAVPLPGAVNDSSLEQRRISLDAMLTMVVHLIYVMRQDAGLIGWKNWKLRSEIRKTRKSALKSFELNAKCVVDRGGPTPDLYGLLRAWRVVPLTGGYEPATDLCGYEMTKSPFNYVEMPTLGVPPDQQTKWQAALFKPPEVEHWRFGIIPGLSAKAEGKFCEM